MSSPAPLCGEGRRNAAATSLRTFCEQYLPEHFYEPWSASQLELIEDLEAVFVRGERRERTMLRGGGATSLIQAATAQSLLFRTRRFVLLIAGGACLAESLRDNLVDDLRYNERIAADFPMLAVTRAPRLGSRAIQVTAGLGAAVMLAIGQNSAMRGLSIKLPGEGHSWRPDVVIADSPFVESVAESVAESERIKRRLREAMAYSPSFLLRTVEGR